MKRILIFSAAVTLSFFGLASISSAQVYVRAPFVRVGVGDGVYVRAPFVNFYIPDGPVYGPRVVTVPPAVVVPQPPPVVAVPQPPPVVVQPQPKPIILNPAPVQPGQVQTLDAFAKSFQPKGGTHEAIILNPLTNQPTTVRFTLPEGTPRRVIVDRNSVEWVYTLRTRVLVEFDRGGAMVRAR
jgi:hypothetical protein